MTAPAPEALAALDRRFVIAEESVAIGDLVVTLEKPRNSDDLISEADYVRDERLPYWADLWPSARALAEYLVRAERGHRRDVASNASGTDRGELRAIELGCGLGLVTIAAQLAGYDVTATDYYEDALLFTARNAARATGRAPAIRMVNWRAIPEDVGRFDLVLAADVLYEREYGPLVALVIRRLLAPGGRALMADQGRMAMASFLDEASRLGLVATEVHREQRPGTPIAGTDTTASHTLTIHELRDA